MEEIYYPNLPDVNYILKPPSTNFDFPVAEVPYLDPVLLPTLEQVQSGLEADQAVDDSKEKESGEEILENVNKELIPQNLPTQESISSETVATFNLPFFGEMPIPAPEVIASSVIAAGTASVVSVAGGIAGQAVLNQIKKIFKKIFTKILKKEVANVKDKLDNKDGR